MATPAASVITSARVLHVSWNAVRSHSASGFGDALHGLQRRQVILAGMETHICVLQTAFDLHQRGYQVFVVEDACCARSQQRSNNGIARMRRAGITVTHSESVLFEWLRDAAHPQFKAISNLLK